MTRTVPAFALFVILFSAGCRGEPSQIVVIIDAQPGVRTLSESLTVRIFGGPGQSEDLPREFVHEVTDPIAPDGWPRHFVLAPRDGDFTRLYRVEAVARRGTGINSSPLVTARVISGYQPRETARIYLLLEDSCIGVRCDEPGSTCRAAECEDARRDASNLEPYVPEAGVPDSGAPMTCSGDSECDDGVGCTTDSCAFGVCVHDPVDASCDDGVPCTEDFCTSTGCRAAPDDSRCDDHVECTVDRCDSIDGCVAILDDTRCDAMPGGVCDASLDCQYPTCTAEWCVPLNDCQADAICVGDTCQRFPLCPDGPCCRGECTDCDDGEFCTDDRCGPAGCEHVPNMRRCDDGDPCTIDDQCGSGVCQPGRARDCDDDDPCTFNERCDAASGGCVFDPAPEGTPCDRDGRACTLDVCRSGVCSLTQDDCSADGGVPFDGGSGCDCPPGFHCDSPSSGCEPDDAGTGARDAGWLEAGTYDAGACAGGCAVGTFCCSYTGGNVCCPAELQCTSNGCCAQSGGVCIASHG